MLEEPGFGGSPSSRGIRRGGLRGEGKLLFLVRTFDFWGVRFGLDFMRGFSGFRLGFEYYRRILFSFF